jgi:L-arabinose isomerase
MREKTNPRIGLLGLMLKLYDAMPTLKPQMTEFGVELRETLAAFAEVDFPGICNTREQVEQAIARFEAADLDLLIVVLLTYAPSHIALPALLRTRLPVLIFNTQQAAAITRETTGPDTTRNHGMHGVQDLANVLLRAGKPFHLVTGHYRDPETLQDVREWCDAARAVRFLRRVRVGLVGYPMEGMGDFALDHTALLSQIGAEVHQIAARGVAERARAAPPEGIARQMADDRARFRFEDGITAVEHEASSRLEWALRETLREGGLHAFASHFIAVSEEGWLDTLPFLAASKLMEEGYGFGGEGDVTSAIAVTLMHELAGAANFTEMFTMDPTGDAVLMMHMGEANPRLARRDEPIHLLHSNLKLVPLRVSPLLLAFSLEPGPVTLVSLTTGPGGQLRLVVAEGAVVDFPFLPALARPHYMFRPAGGNLRSFLTQFSLAGGSHHQALAYGRWAGTIEKIAMLLGIGFARV